MNVGYYDNTLFGCIAIQSNDYLCYKLHKARLFLWSPILSTQLCGVIGLHMTIALEGLGWDH